MIYAACTHTQLLPLCCGILIVGQMANGIGNGSRLEVTTFFGWVMLSTDSFSEAVSFLATHYTSVTEEGAQGRKSAVVAAGCDGGGGW